MVSLHFGANAGCIHTQSQMHQAVTLAYTAIPKPVLIKQLKFESLIYAKDKWLLGNFFENLKKGELQTALKNVDFDYRAANTNDKILKELIAEGFVPVYVRIEK